MKKKFRWTKSRRAELAQFFHDQLTFYSEHQADVLLYKDDFVVAYLGESKISAPATTVEVTSKDGFSNTSFIGTNELSIDSLNALFDGGHDVYTLYEALLSRDDTFSFKTPTYDDMIMSGNIDLFVNLDAEIKDGKTRITINASVSDVIKAEKA